MILSRKWANDYVDLTDIDNKTFCDEMTLSGSKVEGYEVEGSDIENVVVGQVLSMEKHPDSDHLWVCQVSVGDDQPLQIVTGAQNLKPMDIVPVALVGATVINRKDHKLEKIKKGKLRGVASAGMLCSFDELGLTQNDFPYACADGIFVLGDDCDKTLGMDIHTAIGYDDTCVEFEITSNRCDCLSVTGLAREAAATFDRPFTLPEPEVKPGHGNVNDLLQVHIEDGEKCYRYTGAIVENVRVKESPRWLRERLRACGVRPINNIVDITNYVMLEYGQPMHAFDFSCVEGGHIIVRTAREGETIQTLDGNQRNLTTSMLCICDENKPVCVAGVMGGANSEIVGDTAMVLFESANFNGTSIHRTAAALNMRTDASSRYEKGLDPMNTLKAVERACELVELLGAGEVVEGVMDVIAKDSNPVTVKLEPEKVNGLLGTDVSREEMVRILESLDFTVEGDTIHVPSWRSDVEHYSDIAEEVARFYGYNNIPDTLSNGLTARRGLTDIQQTENLLGSVCRAAGYDEIITYSFISPTYYDKIDLPKDSPLRDSLKILNPLGEDTSIMRTTTLPSMLEILTRNYNFRNKSAKLYELGRVYFKRADGLADEPKVLTLGAYGDNMDFFALKGAVEAVLKQLRIENVRFLADSENPSYHPGRCAKVFSGDRLLGVLGQVHPHVAGNYGVDTELYAAELRFDALYENKGPQPLYQPLPKFPAVTRDIAVVCDAAVTVGELEDAIRKGAKGLLKDAALFDIYTGTGIAHGKKSVAFNLTLRSDDRSLTAEEADADVKSILTALEQECGAVLR